MSIVWWGLTGRGSNSDLEWQCVSELHTKRATEAIGKSNEMPRECQLSRRQDRLDVAYRVRRVIDECQ